MAFSRREFIKAGVATGALLVARPLGALAESLGPTVDFSTSRTSRLFPGTWLAHADLHNHTLQSDGDGDPELAFASMRAAGLDIAALTDHTTLGIQDAEGLSSCSECSSLLGVDEEEWQRTSEIADLAQDDGRFTAIRGFEWSSPTMGHMNVWFSERWIDPLHTGGGTTGEGAGNFFHGESKGEFYEFPQELSLALDTITRTLPTSGSSMSLFYRWLESDPQTPGIGGGLDGIAGFNHPGREYGRFGYFKFEPQLRDRVVSIEMFNRREDYIFEGTDSGVPSPLNDCLNKGWKVGLLGVTDEHNTNWGHEEGKGRTGLWVNELTRDGVKEAMVARRFFSTRMRGLRVDASANGARMGSDLTYVDGTPIEFKIDIDRGPEMYGQRLNVQVLRSGSLMPDVLHSEDVTVPTDEEPVISFSIPGVGKTEGTWLVLRISDPFASADGRAEAVDWAQYGNAIAYTSPFFLV